MSKPRRNAVLVAAAVAICFVGVLIARRQYSGYIESKSVRSISPGQTQRTTTIHATITPAAPSSEENIRRHFTPDSVFSRVVTTYADIAKSRAPAIEGYITRFQWEVFYGVRELRLCALAFPKESEKLALEGLQGGPKDEWTVRAFLQILGVIADELRSPTAIATLAEFAKSKDPVIGESALANLWPADREGVYRGIYLEKCNQGQLVAFEALGNCEDQPTIAVLEQIRAISNESSIKLNAADALEKIRIMREFDVATLTQVISNPAHDRHDWLAWAIEVAKRKSLPNLAQLLRIRLDTGIKGTGLPTSSIEMDPSFPHLTHIEDPSFDDVLVALERMGGTVTEWEKKRLRVFGYACNPRERLEELLGQPR